MTSPDNPRTQVIQIPLTGGMKQKTQSEWIDATSAQVNVTNGQFTKEGAIYKRQGLQFEAALSSYNFQIGASVVSWTRGPLASVVNTLGTSYLTTFTLEDSSLQKYPYVPSARTIRRALPSAVTRVQQNTTTFTPLVGIIAPVVIDCEKNQSRLVINVTSSATYVTQLSLVTGEVIGPPSTVLYNGVASAVTGFCIDKTVGPSYVAILLQIAGSPSHAVGITVTGMGTTTLVCVNAMAPTAISCADIAPLLSDTGYGFIYFSQNTSGVWSWAYKNAAWTTSAGGNLETSPQTNAMGTVFGMMFPGTGTGVVGFLYTYRSGGGAYLTRFADLSYNGTTFSVTDAAYTVVSQNNHVNIGGLVYIGAPTAGLRAWNGSIWQLQAPNAPAGINAPQWITFNIFPGTPLNLAANTPFTEMLGMWPVGKPFLSTMWPLSASNTSNTLSGFYSVYQPCISQMCSLAVSATLGSDNTQSEQCTLYLMAIADNNGVFIGLPVSTAAVRQVDPVFSFQWLQYPTASLPISCYSGSRFAQCVNTLSASTPSAGYAVDPSWVTDWYFDAKGQSLLYSYNEIGGDLRLASGVPMVHDGTELFEDNFFYYPELATAYIPTGIATAWPNGSGNYSWAVCYSYTDATGQLQRSSPVFTLPTTGQEYSVAVVTTTTTGVQTLPTGTINVASTTGFPAFGTVNIVTTAGVQSVAYTGGGGGGTTFTGATGGTGNTSNGGLVSMNAPVVAFPPLGVSYRQFVNAEIYRTTNGGGTFYLVATVPGNAQTLGTGTFGVSSLLVVNPGTYTSTPPSVTITSADGPGSGATATAVLSGGGIASVKMTNNGLYTPVPGNSFSVTFSGTGTGATGGALLQYAYTGQDGIDVYKVRGVFVTNPGSGYYGAVTASFSAGSAYQLGSGSGASGTPVVTNIGVGALILTAAGSGYDIAPNVTLSGTATALAYLATPASVDPNNVTYTDTTSDAALAISTVLYTTGGILDSVNPPTASFQCIHWNRLWLVDETLQNIWYTTQFVTGQSPIFNEALTISFPDGGDITGIIGMDGNLIVFKQNAIYYIVGQGPNTLGQGSDLQPPQPIATDTGCVDWRSLVLTPAGVMFQSKTGIYLLDRNLSVSWIGKDIVDTTNQYTKVSSATLVQAATQVRFVLNGPNTTACVVAVYDYLVNSWSVFTYPYITYNSQNNPVTGITTPSGYPTGTYVTTTILNALGQNTPASFYALVDAAGNLWREYDLNAETGTDGFNSPYMDTDTADTFYFVNTYITLAWFKLQGVQGYQRARRVMVFTEMPDPAGITLGIGVNNNSNIVQTNTWIDTTIAKLPLPQVEMHVAGMYNKQQAIQVNLSDVGGTLASTGQGAIWVSVAVELQAIGDRYPQVSVLGRA